VLTHAVSKNVLLVYVGWTTVYFYLCLFFFLAVLVSIQALFSFNFFLYKIDTSNFV
jgi:hypothetical protein